MAAMTAEATASKVGANPILERVSAYLECDPTRLPVYAEEFDPYDHPNVQVAIDDLLQQTQRSAELVGIAAQNRRYAELGLSEILTAREWLSEGPVDYVKST